MQLIEEDRGKLYDSSIVNDILDGIAKAKETRVKQTKYVGLYQAKKFCAAKGEKKNKQKIKKQPAKPKKAFVNYLD